MEQKTKRRIALAILLGNFWCGSLVQAGTPVLAPDILAGNITYYNSGSINKDKMGKANVTGSPIDTKNLNFSKDFIIDQGEYC